MCRVEVENYEDYKNSDASIYLSVEEINIEKRWNIQAGSLHFKIEGTTNAASIKLLLDHYCIQILQLHSDHQVKIMSNANKIKSEELRTVLINRGWKR